MIQQDRSLQTRFLRQGFHILCNPPPFFKLSDSCDLIGISTVYFCFLAEISYVTSIHPTISRVVFDVRK